MRKVSLFLVLLLCLSKIPLYTQTPILVNNLTELTDELNAVRTESTIIKLSDNFDASTTLNASLSWSLNHQQDITLDGNHKEFLVNGNFKHFVVTKTGSAGIVTFTNLVITGRRTSSSNDLGGGISLNSNNSGIYIFDGMRMKSIVSTNYEAAISFQNTPVEIVNSSFEENLITYGNGSAIAGKGNLVVRNCSFYKNENSSYGNFSGGAIGFFNYASTALVTNCYFLENSSLLKGGALGITNSSGGSVTINLSYFEKNKTTLVDNSYSDGGAVSIFGGGTKLAEFMISNSTFVGNEAADDGGAVFIENQGTGTKNSIINCTMFNNKALGIKNDNNTSIYETGGGAIQLSVGSVLTLENNTIVNNSSTFSGGGLGVHAHQTQGTPSFILKNNIILGNTVTDVLNRQNGDNIDAKNYEGTVSLIDPSSEGNIGIDNGVALDPTITVKNVFGTSTPSLQTNAQSSIGKIGNPNDETVNPFLYIEMPTLVIIPFDEDSEGLPPDNLFAKGLADSKGVVSVPPLEFDQQEFYRDDTAPDVGSVEIFWVRFNANGGYWTKMDDYESTDNYYFIRDDDKVMYQYALIRNDRELTVTAPSGLIPPAGSSFLTWVLDDGTDTEWDFSTPITENVKLKATWSGSPLLYNVTYAGNEVGVENFPDPEVIAISEGVSYTVVSPDPTRSGYIFLGWEATSNSPIVGTPTGNNNLYKAGDIFTMPEDNVLLTAQWQVTPPETKPLLQWSVSITNNNSGSFQDVGNNRTTTVREGVNVYLQIRPVVDESITWDSWKIDYTAVPVGNEYPMTTPISKTLRYSFNEGRPHTLAATYDYTVVRLTLYNNGVEVGNYIYDDPAYHHKIVIQKVTVMVSLQWSVSTTSATPTSFSDVVNNSTTAVRNGTPVYLQIRPVIDERIAFDSWEIDYMAVPTEYEYPMTAPIPLTVRYNFNESRPHILVGNYIYTVTRLRLYNGNIEVGNYNYTDTPYRHTIIISEEEESPTLQWSVSTTTSQPSAYRDVDDQSVTSVYEGTPVYLQIRPIVPATITWDSWRIEYTAVPPGYTHPIVGNISQSIRYTFNEGNPHMLVGSYIYSVTRLILYNQGVEVAGYIFSDPPYRHTIVIGTGNAIRPGEIAPWCSSDGELRIPYEYLQRSEPLEYTVEFSETAHQAGFTDVTEYTPLPEGYITIPVGKDISKGWYSGVLRIRYTSNPERIQEYPFTFEVRSITRIVEEPVSVSALCDGDGFILNVEAEGDELSYQWYHNNMILVGATSSSYEGVISQETLGEYYVEVTGYCNTVTSRKVMVDSNVLTIYIKWDDVLYVVNPDNYYVSFQWYKDGMDISAYGKSIYYTDEEGLRGTYKVRAYKADGTYDESCPIYFHETTKGTSVNVYPTIVDKGRQITVEIHQEQQGESQLEMYDFMGRPVYRSQTIGNYQLINADMGTGNFILRITTPEGKVNTKKIIIK